MSGISNMKSSSELEKSKGILVFAFNSQKVKYTAIADQTSKLIKKNTNLPVTIVTDIDAELKFDYDQIIRVDSKTGNVRFSKDQQLYEWKNFDRYRAFDLSPYDETILIDTDYLMLDNSLLKLLEQPFDYRLMYNMQTPQGLNTDEMGPASLPMVWATVVLFRKTVRAKMFFDLVGRIQRNYGYYRSLFAIRETNYRNDFAFSIANIILNGHTLTPEQSIPWPMLTIEDTIESIDVKNKFLTVKYKHRADVISRQNLHIMDKNYLLSAQFKNFVERICND
jgi:hypothetical protein